MQPPQRPSFERRVTDRRGQPAPAVAVTRGILTTLHLERLLVRFPERPVRAVFMFVAGFITIGLLAGIAMKFHAPSIFPSLGASAFLLFFSPEALSAWPRSTVVGHLVGVVCGISALWLVGLHDAPSIAVGGISNLRVLAVALSLASTGATMVLLNAPHPPAGATALIVSLGLITRPAHLGVMVLSVGLLTGLAILINRLAGLPYPFWTRRPAAPRAP